MKKLNKKGFTLIELLAVIILLAIITVVTIPTVLNSIGDARQKTFDTSANTVADWFEKEYGLYQLGTPNKDFKTWADGNAKVGGVEVKDFNGDNVSNINHAKGTYKIANPTNPTKSKNATATPTDITSVLAKAGVKKANYSTAADANTVTINGNRICVILKAADNGDFASITNKEAKSVGCA